MAQTIRIAAIAVATVDGMVDANYQRAIRLGEISLQDQPDIILFPECFAAGYIGTDLTPYGEDLECSPYLQEFCRLSERGDCLVVVGYLEAAGEGVKNAVALYDCGVLLGTHYKSSLWGPSDDTRPYRDEHALMIPGDGIEVFETCLGRFAVLICHENTIKENWSEVAPRVDFMLSPYNAYLDDSYHNVEEATRFHLPSAWANRTGTVYAGDRFKPNLGTAGLCDAPGNIIAKSEPGVEDIVVGELTF